MLPCITPKCSYFTGWFVAIAVNGANLFIIYMGLEVLKFTLLDKLEPWFYYINIIMMAWICLFALISIAMLTFLGNRIYRVYVVFLLFTGSLFVLLGILYKVIPFGYNFYDYYKMKANDLIFRDYNLSLKVKEKIDTLHTFCKQYIDTTAYYQCFNKRAGEKDKNTLIVLFVIFGAIVMISWQITIEIDDYFDEIDNKRRVHGI